MNGWWDFQPVFGPVASRCVPQDGWSTAGVLVPSWWTKSGHAVRRAGESYYTACTKGKPLPEDGEFLFDAFDYPVQWTQTRSGWMRRALTAGPLPAGKRRWLKFDALMPQGTLFINGREIAGHLHPTLPFEVDVTEFVREGENELAVLIEDYPRSPAGNRALTPTGNNIPEHNSGIWQDVWLIERSEVYVADVTIRTSTRRGEICLRWEIANASAHPVRGQLRPQVTPWRKNQPSDALPPALVLPAMNFEVPAAGTVVLETTQRWSDAQWWSPDSPNLYWLRSDLQVEGGTGEVHEERFGFREVWIEKHHLMLNNHPMHLFSDWGHRFTPYFMTEPWIRQWFGMIRDANMNHTRLHTHPHPPLVLQIADEEGILVTGETGMHGSGGAQGSDDPRYWENARDHVRRFIRRDKNHPSVVLWSVENEMRWNREDPPLSRQELPRMRKLFNELDPTRPAYHEGDSSLWNEREQEIISRHYQKECAGVGWWDQRQPLNSGEMSTYHYGGPNCVVHLIGDRGYASFPETNRAEGYDTRLIVESGRTLGVSCFGPWNLSCLQNFRPTAECVRPIWADFTAPGMKPLQVKPHSAEFRFWEQGKGYTPGFSFEEQKQGFRPLAVIDRSQNGQVFAGDRWSRTLFVVNDLPADQGGTLRVQLVRGSTVLLDWSGAVSVKRGYVEQRAVECGIPADTPEGAYEYRVSYTADGHVKDQWTRSIRVVHRTDRIEKMSAAVLGRGSLALALKQLGVEAHYVSSLSAAALKAHRILIIERDAVVPGSKQNRQVRAFVRRGGRVIVMEQRYSLFPKLTIETKCVHQAFVRSPGHAALNELEERDLAFWGEDSYAQVEQDSYVAERMYRKDDGRHMLALLEGGEGSSGSGDLSLTPLFEIVEGEGLILACQLRLTEKWDSVPAAGKLLKNLVLRAERYEKAAPGRLVIARADRTAGLKRYIAAASDGAVVLVNSATPQALAAWSKALGVLLTHKDVGEIWQAVRAVDDPILRGISNEDTCGIETWCYSQWKQPPAADFLVGGAALRESAGMEALWVCATESLLREMFPHQGKTEPLRAHTISRFLFAEKPASGVLLGRVKVGSGCILFNQFAPPPGQRERFERALNRLMANAGKRFAGSLLEGECVPAELVNSPGYPQKCHVLSATLNGSFEKFAANTAYSGERMPSRPILHLAPWTEVESAEGEWSAADLDYRKEILLYHLLESPIPRKNLEMDLGVPNPDAFTFLDCYGEGTVELTLNGKTHPAVTLQDGRGTIADLPLEQGFNHVLIRWRPLSATSRLKLRWRDIGHRPEVSFKFPAWG